MPSPPGRPVGATEALPPPLLTSEAPEAKAMPPAASRVILAAPPALLMGLPAALSTCDAKSAPASNEPPKRKRLGWGQGLARLKTAETFSKPAEDHVDHSPRDSEASRHTNAHRDLLHSPTFSAQFKSEPQPHPPSTFSSPADPACAALQPIVSPYSNPSTGPSRLLPAPPPMLPVDSVDARSPLEGHASMDSMGSRAQKDGVPFSPRNSGPGGFQAAFDLHGGPPASQATLVAPQGSMLPPAESLTKPEPEQAPLGPSKEEIMEDIDRVDTDIQALEKEVADLAASLDDTSAAAVTLKGDISRLHVTNKQPSPAQLSDDEDELQESSEVDFLGGMHLDVALHEYTTVAFAVTLLVLHCRGT